MVGYQFMGKAHSHAYRDVGMFFKPDVLPVMKVLCGRNEANVKEAAKTFGWEDWETSWRKFIKRDDVDLVDIVTPNSTHKDIAVEAARAGKHIFCEKPLAMNFNEAKQMVSAVEKAGVKHMAAFNYRKVPAIAFAKKLIEEGRLGKIHHFRAVYLQDWIADPDFPLVWRLKKNVSGSGVHGDLNSHLIDLGRFLVGEFDSVVGMDTTFIKERRVENTELKTSNLRFGKNRKRKPMMAKVTVDDATLFLARFKNGAIGSFEATRFARGRRNAQRIEVNGSEGSILFELEDMNILWFYDTKDARGLQGFRRIQVTEQEHPYIKAWWPAGHIIGYEHTFVHLVYELLQAIAEKRLPSPNFYDGLECQRVLDAVTTSIKDERWVRV
jgi:predicted dehydrogenase